MWQYNHTLESDELMHYGILGMRWGVRRTKNQLANAERERKASRKAAKLEYKADVAKSKKHGLSNDTESLIRAKKKRVVNNERIEQEHDQEVERIKKSAKTSAYVHNILAGAVGGTLVGAAVARKRCATGKQQVTTILTGAGVGVALSVLKTMKYNDKLG